MPLLDGSERLGVVRVDADDEAAASEEFHRGVDLIAHLLGHLVVIKVAYGDRLARTRRTRPMSAASELLWRVLPPLTFATGRFAVSAVLEPCYEAGGDGFDYAVGGDTAFAVICDMAGHGLPAGLGMAVLLSALRAARVDGADLHGMARAVDAAFTREFTDARFATAVLLELNLADGGLRYLNAGHNPGFLVRPNGRVEELSSGGVPLGLLPNSRYQPRELVVEPGDIVCLYSDGITEAESVDEQEFGTERLIGILRKHQGFTLQEVLETLQGAVTRFAVGRPQYDDHTVVLLRRE
jgi:serine phosphatase RsbU (regulator of sigma subunit)